MSQKSCSTAIFFNPATKQVLLHKRDVFAPVSPNIWALFGGGSEIEDQGDPVKTLIREMNEEVGILFSVSEIVALYDYFDQENNAHRFVFYIETDLDGRQIVLTEGAGYAWVDLAEALDSQKINIVEQTQTDLQYFVETKKISW